MATEEKYLDKDGLEHLWDKAKECVEAAAHGKVYYGTCGDNGAITTKVVDCSDFVLEKGAIIAVRFADTDKSTLKLNVNGTGAQPVYRGNAVRLPTGAWVGGETVLFAYNGAAFEVVSQQRHVFTSTSSDAPSDSLLGSRNGDLYIRIEA